MIMRKGDSHLLCEAPEGPFRQKVAVTFSAHATFCAKHLKGLLGKRWLSPFRRMRPTIGRNDLDRSEFTGYAGGC
jgi:hypothetical protein